MRALYFLAGALAAIVALCLWFYFADPLRLFNRKGDQT